MSDSLFPAVEAHIVDTNLFVTVDLPERAIRAHDVVLLLPSRVCEELTPATDPYGTPPFDSLIAFFDRLTSFVGLTLRLGSSINGLVERQIG